MVENRFLMILTSITFYSKQNSVLWANEWCSNILWYHPRCPLHSSPHMGTLWATIATHLWEKIAENSWKQVFDDTYLQNLLFHTQICSIGKQVVFNYPMLSLKVPTTLLTPYNRPMGHHSHSFVSKYGWKVFGERKGTSNYCHWLYWAISGLLLVENSLNSESYRGATLHLKSILFSCFKITRVFPLLAWNR
jgi:hypothetical protein